MGEVKLIKTSTYLLSLLFTEFIIIIDIITAHL